MNRRLKLKEKMQIYVKNQTKLSFNRSVFILVTCIILTMALSQLRDLYLNKELKYESTKEDSILKATFIGDIMLGRNIKKIGEKGGYSELFQNVSKIYADSDYISGNFETAILSKEESRYTEASKNIHLSSTVESVEALKKEGIDVVSLANNHSYDYGANGIKDTMKILETNDIDYIGSGVNIEDARKYDVKDINGIKIANIGISDIVPYEFSATKNKEGVLTSINKDNLKIIEKANKESDLVVVNIHWGEEYSISSNKHQENIAKKMIDMGADIIVGHHPHVIHSIETYKDGIIFYSLGNFIFDQGWSRTKDSMIVNYTLNEEGEGQFEIIPLRISEGRPTITNNKFYKNRILRVLTKKLKNNDNWEIKDDKLIINATCI